MLALIKIFRIYIYMFYEFTYFVDLFYFYNCMLLNSLL